MTNSQLSNRTMSGFPVSIGTGMALETLFTPIQAVYDESREFESIPDLSIYTKFVFNASTLLRNIINSTSADPATLDRKEVYTALLNEIEFLSQFFEINQLDADIYVNTHKYVKTIYESKNVLRKATTTKQVVVDSLMSYCLDRLKKEDDITEFTKDIRYGKEDSVLLFSHIPFDLLSYPNFRKLDLLESHTGKVKTRKEWNTKYFPVPGKDMSILPLMEYLLCEVFGDHVMFKPSSLQKRIDTYNALQKKGITPVTSEFSLSFIMG